MNSTRWEEDIPLSLWHYERACLERALRQTGGDVVATAALLAPHPGPIYRKLAMHGLGGVYMCMHGKAFQSGGSQTLEMCAACRSGVEIPMENRYK